jgi:hypothetical protein
MQNLLNTITEQIEILKKLQESITDLECSAAFLRDQKEKIKNLPANEMVSATVHFISDRALLIDQRGSVKQLVSNCQWEIDRAFTIQFMALNNIK